MAKTRWDRRRSQERSWQSIIRGRVVGSLFTVSSRSFFMLVLRSTQKMGRKVPRFQYVQPEKDDSKGMKRALHSNAFGAILYYLCFWEDLGRCKSPCSTPVNNAQLWSFRSAPQSDSLYNISAPQCLNKEYGVSGICTARYSGAIRQHFLSFLLCFHGLPTYAKHDCGS